MGSDTPSRDNAKARPYKDDEPLQARGPDPRDEPRAEERLDEAHGKAAGGPHHDKTPPALVKQAQKHKELEKGRPKDTGRAGA